MGKTNFEFTKLTNKFISPRALLCLGESLRAGVCSAEVVAKFRKHVVGGETIRDHTYLNWIGKMIDKHVRQN